MKLTMIGLSAILVSGYIAPAQAQMQILPLAAIQQVNGMDTSTGPAQGKLASAWAVNQFIQKVIGRQIGENPNSVSAIEEALQSGYGKSTDPSKALPGDIVIAPRQLHIGVCLNQGCTKVISNSATRAKFNWVSSRDFDGLLGGNSTIYQIQR